MLYMAELYRKPERILDFGSGNGDLTRELENRGLRVTPLEPIMHGYLKDQRYSEPFDAIFAVEVIEHLPDVWGELRQMERVLAPGGVVVFTTLLTNTFIDLPNAAEKFREIAAGIVSNSSLVILNLQISTLNFLSFSVNRVVERDWKRFARATTIRQTLRP